MNLLPGSFEPERPRPQTRARAIPLKARLVNLAATMLAGAMLAWWVS